MTFGIGSRASRNVWRVSRYGSAGADVATTAATDGSAAAGQDRPDGAHRVTRDGRPGDLGALEDRAIAGEGVETELAGTDRVRLGRVGTVPADVERQAVEARRRAGTPPSAASGREPTPSRGRGRPPGPAPPSLAGMNHAGNVRSPDLDDRRLAGHAEVARRHPRWLASGESSPGSIDERESIGQPERRDRQGDEAGPTKDSHGSRGRHATRTCQARPRSGVVAPCAT